MRRIFGIPLAMLVLGLPLAAQEKKDEKAEKTEKAKALTAKELTKEVLADIQKFQKENKGGDRDELLKLVDAGFEKFLKAIEENPKADDINEMVASAGRFVTKPESSEKLAQVVLEKTDLLKGEKPYQIIMTLGRNNDKFLDKVLEINKSKEVAAEVSFLRAQAAMAKFQQSGKESDKAAVLALVAKVPADLSLDMGARKLDIGKQAAAFPKKIEAIENLLVGKKMPELISKNLEGNDVKLSDFAGKVVVLDVWATWCPPCRAMIPHERDMVKELKDKPFALISISCDAEVKTLKDFLEKEEMPWTHWFAGARGDLSNTLNIEHYPTIFVLDHKGVIRFKEIRGDELEKAVKKLISEAEAK